MAGDLRSNLYAVRINLARQAWLGGDIVRTMALLDSLRPSADQDDLRGFEWYYLWKLCHGRKLDRSAWNGPARSLVYVDSGDTVAAVGEASITLSDVVSGRAKSKVPGSLAGVIAVARSPDGASIAAGFMDGTARIWEAGTLRERAVLAGHKGPVASLAFTPDGKTLATSTGLIGTGGGNPITRFVADRSPAEVRLWEVSTGKARSTIQDIPGTVKDRPNMVYGLAFAPDNVTLAAATADGTVLFWTIADGKCVAVLGGHAGPVFSLAFAPDGRTLATGSYDQTARLWDVGREARAGRPARDIRGRSSSSPWPPTAGPWRRAGWTRW